MLGSFEILRLLIVAKGKTAASVLKQSGWPEKLHQKLIDKPYNKDFRKVANKPDVAVAKSVGMLVPALNPAELKKLQASNRSVEDRLKDAHRILDILWKQLDEARKAAKKNASDAKDRWVKLNRWMNEYEKSANALIRACVADARVCAGIKYPHQILTKKYEKVVKKLSSAVADSSKKQAADNETVRKLSQMISKLIVETKDLEQKSREQRARIAATKDLLR